MLAGSNKSDCIVICGLNYSDNHKSCAIHDKCGILVQTGVVLELVPGEVVYPGSFKGEHGLFLKYSASAGGQYDGGFRGCTVGYIPKHFLEQSIQYVHQKFRVLYRMEDKKGDQFKHERRASYTLGGAAIAQLIPNE